MDNNVNAIPQEVNTPPKSSALREFVEWVETIVISFIVVIFILTFVFRNSEVDGISMLPTLTDGDRVIGTHLFYTPNNGDIIIVDNNDPFLDKLIVKRVIATAGQEVDIDFDAGIVYVDGVALQEDYTNTPTNLDEGGHIYPVVVPEDHVFAMGDNRNHSADSRSPYVGFVSEDDILGKVIFRYFPFNNIGLTK